MLNAYDQNTLVFNEEKCIHCEMCSTVCPHAVFLRSNGKVTLANPRNCMECGACQLNCPTGAIQVESGVGCAVSLMYAAIRGQKEPTCGCS